MRRAPRVGFVGAYHETNTFSSVRTTRADFAHRWYRGEELREAFAGTRTTGGGYLDEASAAGWEMVPLLGVYATPAGLIERPAFDAIVAELRSAAAEAGELDGVLLELHGDMVVDGCEDAEQEIVAALRSVVGSIPMATSLDLHTNMAEPRLLDVDIVTGYRANPHVDTYERGRHAARLLAPLLAGAPRPHRAHRGLPLVVPPAAQLTAEEPLRGLLALAEELEASPELLDVTVHAGYAYADTGHTGMGFCATAVPDHATAAEAAVERLLTLAESTAAQFGRSYPAVAEALDRALRDAAATGPIVVADTGDNINGGAPGDATWLIREALGRPGRRFLGTLADAAALASCREAGVGGRRHLSLGGVASPASGPPVEGEAEVLALSDGRFRNTGPMAHGAWVDMHGAAWIRIGTVDLVIQGVARQPNDPQLFASLGVDPSAFDVLLLKGAAAVRAGWGPLVGGFVDAGTPGETDSVLSRLDYRRCAPRRP